jgi:hypothetical protein
MWKKIVFFILKKFAKTGLPITVAWTASAHSSTGIVGSNPTKGMDVCVYCVFVLGSGLAMGW